MIHYLFYHLIVVALSTMRLLWGLDKIARSRMFRINMVSLSWSSITMDMHVYLLYIGPCHNVCSPIQDIRYFIYQSWVLRSKVTNQKEVNLNIVLHL